MYSKKVMQHFTRPKNMGRIKNPDGLGEAGNPTCGDLMTVTIKVVKNKAGQKIIKDIKFETLGCVAAIATSSMTTELVKGKTLDQSLKVSYKDVVAHLGDLPAVKVHCADLSISALRKAIEDYKKRN